MTREYEAGEGSTVLARRYGISENGVLDVTSATHQEVRDRIAKERRKPADDQGALTFARELRRTLRDMAGSTSTLR